MAEVFFRVKGGLHWLPAYFDNPVNMFVCSIWSQWDAQGSLLVNTIIQTIHAINRLSSA